MSRPSGIAHTASAWIVSITSCGNRGVTPPRLQTTASTSAISIGLANLRHPSRNDSPLNTSTPTVQIAISTPTLCTSNTPRLSGPQSPAMIGSGR